MMLKETSLTAREVDPLLKDLTEKKQNFRHSVVSLAAELKDVRGRLASQEESFARETLIRQAAEAKARSMEDVICQLQRRLEEKNGQLQVSKSDTEQYLKELDNLRSQLSVAQATADESTASAQSMQFQCLAMLRELEEKSSSLKEYENRVTMVGEQLDHLQKDLEAREASQKQLKDEVLKIEEEIMLTVTKAGAFKDQELRKILEEDILKDFGSIKKHLNAKDEEISRLRDEIGVMSAQWKLKTKELELQAAKRHIEPSLSLSFPRRDFWFMRDWCSEWEVMDDRDYQRPLYKTGGGPGKTQLHKSRDTTRWGDSSSDEAGIAKRNGKEVSSKQTEYEEETEAEDQEKEWQQVRRRKPITMAPDTRKRNTFPTLFVKGFPKGWYPLNLERIFGRAGAVMDVVMPRDRETGRYRGFALVRMSSELELARAVTMLHGTKFAGCPLLVQRARFGPYPLPIPKPQPTKIYRPKPTIPSHLPPPPPPLPPPTQGP